MAVAKGCGAVMCQMSNRNKMNVRIAHHVALHCTPHDITLSTKHMLALPDPAPGRDSRSGSRHYLVCALG